MTTEAHGRPLLAARFLGQTLIALAATLACGDGGTEPPPPDPPTLPPDPPTPTTVTVSPATARLTALGATVQFSAQVLDQNGQVMAGAGVAWASSDASVAPVDGSGLVTAAGTGSATVTATSGSASGSAAVVVAQTVTEVTVTPTADTVFAGDTLRLLASAADANGHVVAGAEFAWSSSDTAVARVDGAGLVNGVTVGEATVNATSAGVTGTAQVKVVAPVAAHVTVTPAEALLVALGDTVRLVAEVLDQIGRGMPDAEVAWSSADTMVATVDAAGLVTAAGNGETIVTGASGEVSGQARVSVTQSTRSVTVSPAAGTIAPGDTLRLSASAADANGRVVAGAEFAWSSSDASVASVDDTGLVRGVVPGEAAITAASGGVEGTADITVEKPAESPDRAALVAFHEATGGPNWTRTDGWLSDRPIGEWHGVRVNEEGRVTDLLLSGNNLIGSLAPDLGSLSKLERIYLPFNGLSGRIPPELKKLSRLRDLDLGSNSLTGSIPAELGELSSLESLKLSQNSLSGPIPPELGNLSRLTHLAIGANNYGGPMPPELGNLSNLEFLSIRNSWVTGGIPAELANLSKLEVLNLRFNQLDGPLPAALLTNLTRLRGLSVDFNRLSGPIPPEVGELSQLEWLDLDRNAFTGPVPTEIGNLSNLGWLEIGFNRLSGALPSEIGRLSRLTRLNLAASGLTGSLPPELGGLDALEELFIHDTEIAGSLPPELGRLANLKELHLYNNAFTGPIPAEWGAMTGLKAALLFRNRLSGPLPAELGNLEALEWLWLGDNDLEGGVPPRFGHMAALKQLDLTNNSMMSGPLPAILTQLGQLEAFLAGGTELCVPGDEPFTSWLGRVWRQRVARCEAASESAFLLSQAIQSRSFPVPLVAGERALLRVFVTVADAGGTPMPPVRASFYSGGSLVHVAEIAGQSTAIPAGVIEGDLSRSANAEIPGNVLQPNTELVIEIDPDGTLDSDVQITRRIPEEGRVKLDIRAMPVLDLTAIPFLWAVDPDSSVLDATAGMAADPMGHELLEDTRVLLPIGGLRVANHDPVTVTSNSAYQILGATEAIRVIEGGGGHYMGLLSGEVTDARGVADTPGRNSFAVPVSDVMAHELGHNMSLLHAPCGNPGGPDPAFPTRDGSIGGWGYDFRKGALVPPDASDLMTYCDDRWVSDFSFSNALRYRLVDETPGSARTAAAQPTILLWGGAGPNGTPFLEPALVVSAPPSLPQTGGDHTLVGADEDGRELFSLSFAMREMADSDGRSTFAFALPAQPGWADALSSITLSGPGGSVTVDGDTDRPLAIMRDRGTGQVRAILRGVPGAAQAIRDSAGAAGIDPRSFDTTVSRGIPEAGAWEIR